MQGYNVTNIVTLITIYASLTWGIQYDTPRQGCVYPHGDGTGVPWMCIGIRGAEQTQPRCPSMMSVVGAGPRT